MSTTTYTIPDLAAVDGVAAELAALIVEGGHRTVTFDGEMGAGKTTLIRSIVAAMGADGADGANSPSFAIANDYGRTPSGLNVLHFDLYRLESAAEAMDIGFEDYLDDPDNVCLIEWPDRAEELLPAELLRVGIELQPDRSRLVTVTAAD